MHLASVQLHAQAVDRGMVMGEIKLLEKSGGKTGTWVAEK